MTRQQLDDLVHDISSALGEHMVGDVIETALATGGQIGFATDEDDQGPDVRGKWLDALEERLAKHGFTRCRCMPFPVKGKLVYVVAGLRNIENYKEAK